MCNPLKRGKEWKVAVLLVAAVAMGVPRTASADQCIPDDLIVDGSINCGFDSVCNRNFGFDTLVLSENNLRIFFEDTSTSASFPTNDWRILINDTTNGGNNFFAVEDTTAGNRPFTIRAGAGSNALFVDNGGEVGLGTAVPVVNLHIVDGNTPTVRLDQNGSSGFTPQVWDLAGNEANFFIRDVTNGSTLPFRIRPGAPTSAIDVAAGGNVGLGTGNPEGKLHINVGSLAGFTPNTSSELILERNDAVRMEIATPNSTTGSIWFSDGDFSGSGRLVYDHPNDEFEFRTDNILAMTINNAQGVDVVGTLTKGSGTFKIDHPLDPENKYLSHSFVESPDMMNIYNGNAQLDEQGEAWIEMPKWFNALNRDFRYQLTPLGVAAPELHVAAEITDNHFKISGGVAGARVSWQVTGVRQDAFAKQHPVIVEQDKPEHERGLYLHPRAFGEPVTKSVRSANTQNDLAQAESASN